MKTFIKLFINTCYLIVFALVAWGIISFFNVNIHNMKAEDCKPSDWNLFSYVVEMLED